MAFTPVEMTNGTSTQVVTNRVTEANLRWRGWYYTGSPPPPPPADPFPQYLTETELASQVQNGTGVGVQLKAASVAAVRAFAAPSLPAGLPAGEYVWFKTNGNGALLDILSGVAA